MKMNERIFILFLMGILLISGCVNQEPETEDVGEKIEEYKEISTFEECAKAGYQILMTHPRQCITPDGRTFTEKVASEEAGEGGEISSIELLKKVEVGVGARPEVVATRDRVFVVYIDTAIKGRQAFSVKIYDEDMNNEIAYKILVSTSVEYGKPTDIRVASDGQYLYAFYETVDMNIGKAYLWGAKYRLDDNFERVAYTSSPITTGPIFTKAQSGDEKVDDPITLIGPNSVFVITRIKQRSFSQNEPMIYRVREFSKDLQTKLFEFDLDLSSVADGGPRQASAYYYKGYYYMVVPTTTGNGDYPESMATPSDLLLVKLDKDWKIVESNNLSQDHEDIETFVLGFEIYNGLFFVTYKQGMPFVCPLKVYDQNLNLVSSKIVKETSTRESLRSALEVTDDRIYVGLSAGQGPPPPGAKIKSTSREPGTAEIYVYEIVWGTRKFE
ncbi:MAG: hypothetical protein ACE5K0_12545, partial [Candidatus Methanofastidiosia archaeon]